MTSKQFDPTKFIDREFESELFEDMLRFESPARILAICDKGGMGKSQLLEKFQYRCRTVPSRTPVSFIALDQLAGGTPLSLAKALEKDLSPFGLKFERFKKFESARVSADFSPFRSAIYLEGSSFEKAYDVRISGYMVNVERAENLNVTTSMIELSPEQENVAQEVAVDSFFEDLQRQAAAQKVVLLFDAFEKCAPSLKSWIMEYLLERHFFNADRPSSRLVCVLAGRELPVFHTHWPKEDCDNLVRSVSELVKWEKKHVAECLRVHGYNYSDEAVDGFYKLMQEEVLTPSAVVQLTQDTVRSRRQKEVA